MRRRTHRRADEMSLRMSEPGKNGEKLIGIDVVVVFKGRPGDTGAAPPRRLQVWPRGNGRGSRVNELRDVVTGPKQKNCYVKRSCLNKSERVISKRFLSLDGISKTINT